MTIDERALEAASLKTKDAFGYIKTEVNEDGQRQVVIHIPDHWMDGVKAEDVQACLDRLSVEKKRDFLEKLLECARLSTAEKDQAAAN